MPFIRLHWLLAGFLLVLGAATAYGQQIYKWQDAGGAVHFTDTPPPPDATLLKGPKLPPGSAPNAAVIDKPMLPTPCRPDTSPADCDAARRFLQAYLDDLERSSQQMQKDSRKEASEEEMRRRMAVSREKECSRWRYTLGILQDRNNGKFTETLTEEELADIPAQIAEAERQLANHCD